ncbi:hypothetical protein [Algihabitans sp.]|uniref:hypothetical protein n=1 Tax=Algihabitans sp. TaxID=2821514 RepID=UPI003BABCCC7
MNAFQNICILGVVSVISFVGVSHPTHALDLSAFSDCAVISAKATNERAQTSVNRIVEIQIVPGLGSALENRFFTTPLPPRIIDPRDFSCKHRHTRPVTNAQVSSALSEHLATINAKIKANTVEVQQTVAQSFAIQIDILIAEVAEIRSLLSVVDEQDAAVIGARLDSLETRLDALTQITNN